MSCIDDHHCMIAEDVQEAQCPNSYLCILPNGEKTVTNSAEECEQPASGSCSQSCGPYCRSAALGYTTEGLRLFNNVLINKVFAGNLLHQATALQTMEHTSPILVSVSWTGANLSVL